MVGPKILILTTNYGNGHLQVAHSLEQEFIQQGMNSVFVKDLYYETSPRLNELTRKIYLRSFTTSGSHIYQLFYYSSKEISKRKNLKILSYGYSKLKKIIADVEPDIIINTFPSFAVPIHRRKTNSLIPTYNVITDYCLHHSWLHPNIDKYYVASRQLKQELIQTGINEEEIIVTGMPIKKDFEHSYSEEQLYQKYRLNPKLKTVLIVAGAYGVSKDMKEICERLKDDPRLQLMIVCGKNEVLFEQLQLKYRDYKNITIYGYVTEMAELLKVATCVITKPGGIILSEAMAMKTPIVLPKATPGQEKENARFFQQQGAALWNENLDQLVIETKQLLKNESKLNEMKQALANLYFPRSTEAITTDILQDYYCRRVNNQLIKVK